jgi:hydroxymethylpyrimidine pyrophosphatase-like HAD family hydrolase/fructoselysine-6-P-deglycase FrlB-like protein
MGKSFSVELQKLGVIYDWARATPIDDLATAIINLKDHHLLASGSGGSLTVAHFMTKLHEKFTGKISKHLTPMELISSNICRDAGVALITARGKNKDILEACRRMATHEPNSLLVLCATQGSPVSKIAEQYKWTRIITYPLPSGNDGFLATNSLLAFSIILIRAYSSAFQMDLKLPEVLPEESGISGFPSTKGQFEKEKMLRVLQQPTISVLFGGWGHSAAVDMESKFTEAALGNVQIADYRNFAHGRHHWLAKRGSETGIVAMVTPQCEELANKTLALIPSDIPVTRISTRHSGPIGTISLLISVLYMTGVAGEVANIDPGRPGVPQFGRKIYHIGLKRYQPERVMSKPSSSVREIWLERKFGNSRCLMRSKSLGSSLEQALTRYLQKIRKAHFAAIVCDYDGTLCSPDERFGVPSADIISECIRLSQAGMIIGIATGRGKSARESLRRCFPQDLWPHIIIGYYNGGDISRLDEEAFNPGKPIEEEIQAFCKLAEKHVLLQNISKLEPRTSQVTIEPLSPFPLSLVHAVVLELVQSLDQRQLRVFCSEHSVDVLTRTGSKRKVVKSVKDQIKAQGKDGKVLCIGDKGTWCGNDFDLLSEDYALSIDECPLDLNKGWNLALRGHRGVQATLDYLRALIAEDDQVRLDLHKLRIKVP